MIWIVWQQGKLDLFKWDMFVLQFDSSAYEVPLIFILFFFQLFATLSVV